jgi:hypothetical protein
LKNENSIENQAEVSKRMKICGAKHSNVEDELFEWFCHARANNISLESPLAKEKANKIALNMGIEFHFEWLASTSQAAMKHHMASH